MSLIFYDSETSGISTQFDQILQFAAIRTDADLNEISRFESRSRLLPYVLPSPGALKVTGMTIDQLLDQAHPTHYEMVTELRRTLGSWCPGSFVGYNSLRFDEELLRQAFYQCLHPPYLTNTGGSMRADAMHLVRAAAVLHPDALVAAQNDKGGRSFKLDRLAPINGFNHSRAHDAMADVEALIFLCRIIRDRCPELWARFNRFGHKAVVDHFLRSEDAFVVLEYFPVQTGCYVTTWIGQSGSQPNIEYAYDLSVDPDELLLLDDEQLARRLTQRPRPLRKIRKNAAPTLCPIEEAPDAIFQEINHAEFRRRAGIVRANVALNTRLIWLADRLAPPRGKAIHVEQQIYDGFWSNEDERRLASFHSSSWEERAQITEALDDERLKWLARRLIFVERPDVLAPGIRSAAEREIAARHLCGIDESGGWTPLCRSIADTQTMIDTEPYGDGAWYRLADYLAAKQRDAEATSRSII